MTSVNYIKDDEGATFIPSSQRPDGTWRRPIRVKDGYVPQEEQPLYVSKGKQFTQYRSDVPVGMTEKDVASYRSSSSSTTNQGQRGTSSLYFDVGLYTPAPVSAPIPGLNFVETSESEKPAKKKKSKSKSKQADATNNETAANPGKKQNNQAASGTPASNPSSTTTTAATDPVKRLRNLRKRLKDIEALEKKIESGELQNPEKEQVEKIQRKEEVLDEIDDLEKLIDRLNLS